MELEIQWIKGLAQNYVAPWGMAKIQLYFPTVSSNYTTCVWVFWNFGSVFCLFVPLFSIRFMKRHTVWYFLYETVGQAR